MKKLFLFFLLICAVVLSAGEKLPKYIILFIGDGMSTPQRMMAEEFSRKTGKGELVINHFPFHASTRTVSTSSLVTDSAAAGTAIACGTKTANGRIGVSPDGKIRFESVAELAKKKNVSINLLGGMLIKENLSTVSSLASVFFADANFEVAILSAASFTIENGFACSSQMEADLCRLICQKAKAVYMLLDSSKIGKIKPYTFARLEDINVLVTDSAFPQQLKSLLQEKNVVLL
jgi:hypothetical protein